MAVSDNEKAEILSDVYVNTFTDTCDAPPNTVQLGLQFPMTDSYIEISEILKYLKELKTTTSPGPDNIHPRILRELAEELCGPLTKLFNLSLHNAEIPCDWRTAIVTPIFKKKDRSDPTNYRPVSLTPVLCKVLEKCIRDKIVKHNE